MTPAASDTAIRSAMLRWLDQMVAVHGDVLARSLLMEGFPFGDGHVPAVHPAGRGIWKPANLDTALSILTGLGSPYSDHFEGDRLAYSYQGSTPESSDNSAVRRAMTSAIPLAYFHAVERGWYLVVTPVLVVGDEPDELRFWIQHEPAGLSIGGASISGSMEGATIASESDRRAYGTRQVEVRLHQRSFRERVLKAYRSRCAMCRLRHRELLDAAHIVPDSDGGQPVVSNGLALCKIHHAAFDARVIGVDPDGYRLAVREDVLREVDGPMLLHGIQELQGSRLWVPKSADKKPSIEALTTQWRRFRETA